MQPSSNEARRQKFLWTLTCWAAAALIAIVAFAAMIVSGAWALLQALFAAGVLFVVFGGLFITLFTRDLPPPVIQAGGSARAQSVPAGALARPVAEVPAQPAVAGSPGTIPAPAAADPAEDLQRIRGIGPKLAALLVEKGVGGVAQIATWRDEDVAWWDANLEGFKGRASRDDWVAQARELMAEETAGGDAARKG